MRPGRSSDWFLGNKRELPWTVHSSQTNWYMETHKQKPDYIPSLHIVHRWCSIYHIQREMRQLEGKRESRKRKRGNKMGRNCWRWLRENIWYFISSIIRNITTIIIIITIIIIFIIIIYSSTHYLRHIFSFLAYWCEAWCIILQIYNMIITLDMYIHICHAINHL